MVNAVPKWLSLLCALCVALSAGIAMADDATADGNAENDAKEDAAKEGAAKEGAAKEGAVKEDDSSNSGTVALPGIFFTPDTGFSVFLAGMRYFRVSDDSRPSKLTLSLTLSTSDDIGLGFTPDLWLDNDRLHAEGTVEVASKSGSFFGIGNDALTEDLERYRISFVALQPRVTRLLPHSLYVGGLYDFRLADVDATETIQTLEGGDEGLSSGLGLLLRWDTRDSTFYPTSGALFEVSPRWYSSILGSDHSYWRFRNDFRYWINVAGPHVIALQAQLEVRTGEAPFDQLAFAGGGQLLRGMLSGRYRDDVFAGAQVEYRTTIHNRLGAVVFGAAGRVAPSMRDLELRDLHYAGGVGLRFNVKPDEHLNLRADFAVSEVDTGLYLNILEAF